MVKLVRMSREHLDATLKWLTDPALRRRIDCLDVPTPEENKAYWQAHWKNPAREDYAILDGEGRHVGNGGLTGIDRSRKKAELWIYLESGRVQEGIGSAALEILLSRGFNELQLNRVYVRVLENNTPALNFFRSHGFQDEGRWREDTRSGEIFVDSLWLSLLAREYRIRSHSVKKGLAGN